MEANSIMQTYSREHFEQIAAVIGKDIGNVLKHTQLFEAAARWYRIDWGVPPGPPPPEPPPEHTPPHLTPRPLFRTHPTSPSKKAEQLRRIAKAARRLPQSLGIEKYEDAADGPSSFELLDALAGAAEPGEDAVLVASGRIANFATMMDAIVAAGELELHALQAAEEVIVSGKMTIPKGHQGDVPVNNWIAEMMEIYRKITGIEPATSVGHVDQPNEGIASGPFIRFLQAAGKPLGIGFSEDALRSRVRTILKSH
jgi:hypothetical protein